MWRGGNSARPICFGSDPSKLEDYLVPSVIIFDGRIVSVPFTRDERGITIEYAIPNFKMCLACVGGPSNDCEPANCTLSNWSVALSIFRSAKDAVSFVNAVFLGVLIFRSRNLVREELRKQGVKGPIRWSANLAVPERYMDDSPTLRCFDDVLRIAWLMSSVYEDYPDLSKFEELLDCYISAKQSLEVAPLLDCFVYPEVGAEVASVTMSRSAKQGLYAFVDIGAGTVDASVFRFHRGIRP